MQIEESYAAEIGCRHYIDEYAKPAPSKVMCSYSSCLPLTYCRDMPERTVSNNANKHWGSGYIARLTRVIRCAVSLRLDANC
jgi:hypothetical protein